MSDSQSNVMFVFGEGRHGHELSMTLAQHVEKEQCFKSFIMVVDEHFRKEMDDIKTGQRAHVEHVNFKDSQNIRGRIEQIIKKHQVNWLILSPPGETLTMENLKQVTQAFKQSNGKNVVLLSVAMCDKAGGNLKRLHELEQCIQNEFHDTNAILRSVLPYLDLDFFTQEVKERRTWRLPVSKGRWAPMSLMVDVAQCLGKIAMHKEINKECAGQIFTLTGTQKIDGDRLAQMTGSAFKDEVRFEDISLEQAGEILDRYQNQGQRRVMQGDTKNGLRLHLLTKAERDMLLEVFDMIKKGEYDFETDHVQKISGQEPMAVEQYIRMRQEHLSGRK